MFKFAGKEYYTLGIYSKGYVLSPEVIPSLLSCPSLQEVLLPARLPVAPRKEVLIEKTARFDLSLIPKAFQRYSTIYLPLDGDNGTTLEFTLSLKKEDVINFGHAFLFFFMREHIEQGILSIAVLKQIIAEVSALLNPSGIKVSHFYPRNIQPYQSSRRPKVYHGVKLELEWFSYYSPADLSIIGRERFDNLRTCYEKYDFMGGIMIILQEEPFDERNPKHIARRLQAEKELGFDLLPDEPIAKG